MAAFEPFCGLRYDQATAPVAEVIAPPYDVVSAADWTRLAMRSPYNSILLELPAIESGSQDRYAKAAALLEAWQHEGVLRRDDVESFYVYRMRFSDENGVQQSTTGVVGALGIDEPGGTEVLPHERTMPKPRGDRLELLRACRANLSPIWGLSLAAGLSAACIEAIGDRTAPMVATDDEGVIHELWPVSDSEPLASIRALVASGPVVIADGHHRYETAVFYRSERRAAAGGAPGPYDAVMAYLVELTEDELAVRAIHRLVSGLPTDLDLPAALGLDFEVEAGPATAAELSKVMAVVGAIGLVTATGNYLLRPRAELLARAEADLDASRLDAALAGLPPHDLRYQHGAAHIAGAVGDGSAQAGFLLRPATVAQIADTAHSGRRMPPKTTFFYPKPRTGLVFRSVDD